MSRAVPLDNYRADQDAVLSEIESLQRRVAALESGSAAPPRLVDAAQRHLDCLAEAMEDWWDPCYEDDADMYAPEHDLRARVRASMDILRRALSEEKP